MMVWKVRTQIVLFSTKILLTVCVLVSDFFTAVSLLYWRSARKVLIACERSETYFLSWKHIFFSYEKSCDTFEQL